MNLTLICHNQLGIFFNLDFHFLKERPGDCEQNSRQQLESYCDNLGGSQNGGLTRKETVENEILEMFSEVVTGRTGPFLDPGGEGGIWDS